MNSAGKTISWVCTFSVLFMSCTSSAVIDPTGDEKDLMYSGEIGSVVKKDSTIYTFPTPPTIVEDSLVWFADVKQAVSIPLSDVIRIHERQLGNGKTEIGSIYTKDGRKYEFPTPPITVRDSVVGSANVQQQESIPLSTVSKMHTKQLGNGETEITSVIMKDGSKREFPTPPIIVEDSLVWFANVQQALSIPLSDVSEIHMAKQFNTGKSVLSVFGTLFGVLLLFLFMYS
jgi:hypothetical protein